MGLDMYLYKVTRLSAGEKARLEGARFEQFEAEGFSCFDKENVDEDYPELFRKVKGLLTPIDVVMRIENLQALKRDEGIPEDAYVCSRSISPNSLSYAFETTDGFSKKVTFALAEYEKKYVLDETRRSYSWKKEQIGYWRKDYGLQERIYESALLREREAERLKERRRLLRRSSDPAPLVREDAKKWGEILNTEYYPLTKRQVAVIERACGKTFPKAADAAEAIVYWEWY